MLIKYLLASTTLNGQAVLHKIEITATSAVLFSLLIILLILLVIWITFRFRKTNKALRHALDILQRQIIKSETIIEALPVGVEVYSPEGKLISLNSRDCEIFGVAKPDVLKGNISIDDNPNLPDSVKQGFARKEKVHANFPYDFSAVHETKFYGTTRPKEVKRISFNATPVFDQNGEMQNYVFIVDDITQQYNQEQKLKESKRLFDQTIQTADMVLWKYNNHNRLLSSYNDPINNFDRNAKLTLEDHIPFMHPDDRDILKRIITWMDEGHNKTFEFDIRIKTPQDTTWQYCTISGTPFLRDEHDRVVEYTGFRRNNTRWKELNDNLKKVNIQNEVILNNTNSGLVYITTDFIVQWENISVCSASLSSHAYKKGEICYKSTHGRTTPCEDCVMTKAARSGLTEQKVFCLNGRSVETTATPIWGDNGKIDGVVVKLDDITERQRMISELKEAKEKAIRSDKLKSAFLANMSHEIRTPLNAIVGFADLLMSTEDPEEKETYNKIISTNNELLLRLINDILDLSKIEAGFIDRNPEEFDFSAYFDELSASMRQRITNPGIEFTCINPYTRCMVNLDKNRLAQLLLNYVTNSIKYTPKGFIRMGYEYTDGGIRIYVSDSGIGISEDKMHRVYHRFEKLDEFAQGTGLGLSICKAITETCGGRVGCESKEGVGSTFWSWIPCQANIVMREDTTKLPASALQTTGRNTGNNTTSGASGTGKPTFVVREKKILVAEDIESNYKLVHAILHNNYKLSWVKNGLMAVEKARTESFDLILMDIKMPELNGLEATTKIREFNTAIPVIALTAHAFDSDKEAALLAGCNNYLVKPINKEELFGVLKRWL